ncbi:MAG: TolC family protein [Nitrospirae bacterium]|nr:TolC family protein [Candidatus Manganitrophaceae bacterium]
MPKRDAIIRFTITLLLLSTPAWGETSPPRTLSLGEALQTARTNQPQLRQARAGTEAARARADEARAPLLPQVSANANYQRATANRVIRPGATTFSTINPLSRFDTFDFYSFGLGASQLVYDFGQTTGRWKAAKAIAQAQAETERATLLEIDLNLRIAYFNARAAKELLQVAQETLANQERHFVQVQGFVQVGTQPEIDLAQARTNLANARVQLINAQNGYETGKAQLNQAMGIEGPTNYDVVDETLPPLENENSPIDPLLEEALKARPEFAAFANQVRAQELTMRSIKGAYWPTLSVSTDLTKAGTGLGDLAWNWDANVLLSWPLFQGGLTRAQSREARANLTNLNAQVDTFRQEVRLVVDQARLAVLAAQAAIGAAGEAVLNAKEQLRLAEKRYETGVGNIIELSDAQLALTNAEAQKVQADYNLASARARLLQALGRTS